MAVGGALDGFPVIFDLKDRYHGLTQHGEVAINFTYGKFHQDCVGVITVVSILERSAAILR